MSGSFIEEVNILLPVCFLAIESVVGRFAFQMLDMKQVICYID